MLGTCRDGKSLPDSSKKSKPFVSKYFCEEKYFKRAYICLIVLRFIVSLNKGYIHPDEFFQSSEIVARDLLGVSTKIPWEFDPAFPCRSIIFPYLFVSPPFFLLKYLSSFKNLDWVLKSNVLFMAVRFTFTIYSFGIDYCLFKVTNHDKRVGRLSVLLWSTSYLHAAYFLHSFSNCIESILVSFVITIALYIYWSPYKNHQSVTLQYLKKLSSCVMLGIIVAVGIATRITFLVFIFPVALECFIKSWIYRFRSSQLLLDLTILVSFVITFGFIILADSMYFESFFISVKDQPLSTLSFSYLLSTDFRNWKFEGNLVFTMINHFTYNTNKENLKTHGLHPRFLHLFVNTPLLFLPLLFGAFYSVKNGQLSYKTKIMAETIVCGTCLLSLIPHQEPRFLLPLTFPYLFLCKPLLYFDFNKLLLGWVSFNIVLGLFYGGLHQAGVVPLLETFQSGLDSFSHCEMLKSGSSFNQYTVLCSGGNKKESDFYVSPCDRFKTYIFSHKVLMLPRHLVLPPANSSYSWSFRKNHEVFVEDLIGYDNRQARQKLASLNPPIISSSNIDVSFQNQYWHLERNPLTESPTCSRVILITTAPRIGNWSFFEPSSLVLNFTPISPSRFELAVFHQFGGSLDFFLECVGIYGTKSILSCLNCPVSFRAYSAAPYLTQNFHINTDEFDSVFDYLLSNSAERNTSSSPINLYARQIIRHQSAPTLVPAKLKSKAKKNKQTQIFSKIGFSPRDYIPNKGTMLFDNQSNDEIIPSNQ